MIRFVESGGERFRVLGVDGIGGYWLISYDNPAEPYYVSPDIVERFRRIETPDDFTEDNEQMSSAEKRRMTMIQPLLDDQVYIRNRSERLAVAKELAKKENTTVRRLLRMYYRYLATGELLKKKKREFTIRDDYDWAIRTFYFSAKRFSLKTTYDMMLMSRYTDADGNLVDGIPSWDSFRHYFYDNGYHKEPQKSISREGLTNYLRNIRPMYGSGTGWREKTGSFQMDATLADIYLVSRVDREMVVGRPYIYLAVDTATQLIAGVYVGMEAGEIAVMQCLVQAVEDKVAYCKSRGVEISDVDWPNCGMPYEVITDKGREFFGGRMMELCTKYGVEIQSLPPFRPDQKGMVEKAFDLLQRRYKPLLRGKGVIEEDAGERWAKDYRDQAILDVDEFTQIIIHCIIYLNCGRVLSNGETPAEKWLGMPSGIMTLETKDLRLIALPRKRVKLTRKGFLLNKMTYVPSAVEKLCVGEFYDVAYNKSDVSCAYVILYNTFLPCFLSKDFQTYEGMSFSETKLAQDVIQKKKQAAKQNEIRASIAALQNIGTIIDGANGKTQSAKSMRGDI